MVFIRRSVQDDPVYRLALRNCIGHLVRRRADFGWSIEGVARARESSARRDGRGGACTAPAPDCSSSE
jgi:glycerol-3-phosphate O-acyltransferase